MSDLAPLTQRDVEALRTTLDKLDRTVSLLPDRIEATYVRRDVYERDHSAVSAQLAKHEDWLQWALRIVVGLVIAGLVGLLVMQRAAGVG